MPTETATAEKMMCVSDVCERLNISPPTCYRLMNTGQLSYIAVGRGRRVRPADLEEYVERNTVRRAGS